MDRVIQPSELQRLRQILTTATLKMNKAQILEVADDLTKRFGDAAARDTFLLAQPTSTIGVAAERPS